MNAVEAAGIIGEFLSWVGAAVGIPCLALALIFGARDRKRRPVEVTVIDDIDERSVAIWTVADRTYSQAVDVDIRSSVPVTTGFVSPQRPERVSIDKRSQAERLCTTLAIIMLGTGLGGFIASTASLFW